MRVRAASSERITVRAGLLSGPVLASVPLAALAGVPLLAGGTALSVLASCALLLLAITCVLLARLCPARVDVFPRRRQIKRRRRRVSFDEVEPLSLSAALGSPAESYEVRVRLRDGSDWLLLSGLDPARVLCDLRRIVELTGLAVERGWGMPTDARPWLEPSGEPTADATHGGLGSVPVHWRTQSSQPLVALTVLIAAILTAAIIGTFITVRLVEGKGIGAQSLALGSALVLALLWISAAVARERIEIEGNGTLVVRIRSWGVTRQLARMARADLVRVYPVQAASRRHLLIETRSGPVAVPFGARGRLEDVLPRPARTE
jgi:hypothetical protein